MAILAPKYVVQVRKNKRWKLTFWTHRGRAVSMRAAKKAVERAKAWFPRSEYRIKEVPQP